MFKNYIIIAWRNLLRNRLYALLNVAGLSIGLACSLIVFWFIRFQTSFDHDHSKIDRIYQITTEFHSDGVGYSRGVPAPMYKAMAAEFPQYKSSMCIEKYDAFIAVLDNGGKVIKKFKEEGPELAFVQPDYFSIFDINWQVGDPKKSLEKPNTIVISEKMAKKYFGSENPIGRVIRYENQLDLEVTGVVDNVEENTDLPYQLYVSFQTLPANPKFRYGGSGLENWGGVNSSTYCFLLIPENVDVNGVKKQMVALNKKYHGTDYKFYRQPLIAFSEMHHSENYNGSMPMKWIWIMSVIGMFLIVTACFNFINMATAQALRRSKEVGVRKAVGGTRSQVFIQFITETALITFTALIFGLALALFVVPNINTWLDQPGVWPAHIRWGDGLLWAFLVGVFIVVVFLAGSYPGGILAGFRPVLALKGNVSSRTVGGISLRRGLIIFQFILIQLLVICTLVVNNQVDFMLSRSVGYETKGIVQIPIPTPDKVNQETFRQRLMEIPGITNASFCLFLPTTNSNNTSNFRYDTRQKDELWGINTKNADNHYVETFGLTFLAGENIPMSDTIRGYLVNERVLERLGVKDPKDAIGKNLKVWEVTAPIYGVLKNWNNGTFKNGIDPIVIFSYRDIHHSCAIKLNTRNLHETMAGVEKLWNEYFPDYLYEQTFLDEQITKNYALESLMLKLIRVFSFIAIFIGCLGLYGLVKFMASQKTKEIGVRKVLGASITSIIGLFGKEIALLITIAFLIAAPLGWYVMHGWLQDYEYRISIGVGIMVLAIGITFIVAAITAGYESVKAALINPVKSLKSE